MSTRGLRKWALLLTFWLALHSKPLRATDQTVSGDLTVTGTSDFQGDTLTFGMRSDNFDPGIEMVYTDGSTSILEFNANRSANIWKWQQDGGTALKLQMSLDGNNALRLFDQASTPAPKITLDPLGTSTFENSVVVNGTDNQMPNQTLTGAESVMTEGLGDARYLSLSASTIAIGTGAGATGLYSTSLGNGTTASGDYSIATGKSSATAGGDSAFGASLASGGCSTATGLSTATGAYSVALGRATASGFASSASGYYTTASGKYAFASGNSHATGQASVAIGNATADGFSSIALGESTAEGMGSIAIGYNCHVTESGSTALGWYCNATGGNSCALGAATLASGSNSTSLGGATLASGENSTSLGLATIASGHVSTAMGQLTLAEGDTSTAMGYQTLAEGVVSTAMGNQTTAPSFGSVAMGQFNVGAVSGDGNAFWRAEDTLLELGNGTDADHRSNAMVVYKNGNVTAGGVVTAQPGGDIPMYTGN